MCDVDLPKKKGKKERKNMVWYKKQRLCFRAKVKQMSMPTIVRLC